MIITSSHHGVNRWLLLTSIGIVWIVAWDDEVIHLFLQNLLPCAIFYIASSCSSSVFAADIVFIVLDSIFNSEVRVAIEFLSPWAIFVSCSGESLSLLGHDSHRVNHHRKVLFKVRRAQHLQLQSLHVPLFHQFGQHLLPSFGIIMEVILDLFRFKNVEVFLLSRHFLLLVGGRQVHGFLRLQHVVLIHLGHLHVVCGLYLWNCVLVHGLAEGTTSTPHVTIWIGGAPIA